MRLLDTTITSNTVYQRSFNKQLAIRLSTFIVFFFFMFSFFSNAFFPFFFHHFYRYQRRKHIFYPQVLLLNPQTLYKNKQKLSSNNAKLRGNYKDLIITANKLLSKKAPSVVDKSQTPPDGDKHDYLSLAPYYWPDPKKTNGLPYISRDGKVNPLRDTVPDLQNFTNMISWSQTLSLAYYFSHDERYASKSAEILRTWFINPKTKMNPRIIFSQGSYGRNVGSSGGIIEFWILPNVIDAIDLIEHSSAMTQKDKDGLKQWFTYYLTWLETSKFGKAEAEEKNNHGTWYDVQHVAILLYLGRTDDARRVLSQSGENRINVQIQSDGKQPMEVRRTKSWEYSVYNLQALCDLAVLGDKAGVDLWNYKNPHGGSILKAITFLVPYALKKQKWPYEQITPLNPNTLIVTLKQAAAGVNSSQYYDFAQQLDLNNTGKNGLIY